MASKRYACNISWHFFASSHGKGAVDGVGAVLKRKAWQKVKARQVIIRDAAEFTKAVGDGSIICIYLTNDLLNLSYAELSQEIENAKKVRKGIINIKVSSMRLGV